MHRIPTLLGTISLAAALCASAQTPIYLDAVQPIEERVEDALRRMTLEEKVAMCHAQSKFSSPGVPRLGIPELWWSDGPHGVRAEINWNDWDYSGWTNDSITAFPALTALAATWNRGLAARYGQSVGEEVVQLYIADEKSSVLRPVKELKGFQKVAIEAGETVEVTFTVTLDDLKFFDGTAHAWAAEPGRFRALIGSSSTDIRAVVTFEYDKKSAR